MGPLAIHYKNKYPGAHVVETETSLDVYDGEGEHRVAVRKNGAGQWMCTSKQMGCIDAHDLAPIPKDARVHKAFADGSFGLDDKAAERKKKRAKYIVDGRIASCDELKASGWEHDEKGVLVREPAKAAPQADD